MRRGLLDNVYQELAIGGEHAVFIESLPPIHKDPFDRILIAQAIVESIAVSYYFDSTLRSMGGRCMDFWSEF